MRPPKPSPPPFPPLLSNSPLPPPRSFYFGFSAVHIIHHIELHSFTTLLSWPAYWPPCNVLSVSLHLPSPLPFASLPPPQPHW